MLSLSLALVSTHTCTCTCEEGWFPSGGCLSKYALHSLNIAVKPILEKSPSQRLLKGRGRCRKKRPLTGLALKRRAVLWKAGREGRRMKVSAQSTTEPETGQENQGDSRQSPATHPNFILHSCSVRMRLTEG